MKKNELKKLLEKIIEIEGGETTKEGVVRKEFAEAIVWYLRGVKAPLEKYTTKEKEEELW